MAAGTAAQSRIGHLHLYKWTPAGGTEPRAIVQLSHGSCEHAGRYERFARYLTERGYVVYANDHLGHGMTAETLEELGYFGERDGWLAMVHDLDRVGELARTDYPGLPTVLLGHSMGSFLARHYAMLHGRKLAGLIATGTLHQPRFLPYAGRIIARLEIKFRGIRHRSALLNKMSYESFNRRFKPARTSQDWLTRDEAEVDRFLQDERCGYVFTSGAFRDMFDGLLAMTDPAQIRLTPRDLPILLLSGRDDPVGGYGAMVERACRVYRQAGMTDVTMKLYDGMRHEILNETGREEVYADIAAWLERVTK